MNYPACRNKPFLFATFLFFLFSASLGAYGQKGSGKSSSGSGASSPSAAAASSPAAGGASSSSSPAPSPYVASFDGKNSNLQGIPFDVPVVLQFFFNQKVNIRSIGYLETKNKFYRKLINGKYDSASVYFQKAIDALSPKQKHIVLLIQADTFELNTDPTGPKYSLTIHTPVFLKSGKSYIFGYSTSINSNEYFPLLNRALVKFIQAHEARNPSGSPDANERKLSADYKVYTDADPRFARLKDLRDSTMAYQLARDDARLARKTLTDTVGFADYFRSAKGDYRSYKRALDSLTDSIKRAPYSNYMSYKKLVYDWETIYKANYSSPDSTDLPSKSFKEGAGLYKNAYKVITAKYMLASIPYYDYAPAFPYLKGRNYTDTGVYIKNDIYKFFAVYKLSLDLDSSYRILKLLATDTLKNALFAFYSGKCIPPALKTLASCYTCKQDSTGFFNFLLGMMQQDNQNPFVIFFNSFGAKLKDPDLYASDKTNLTDTLTLVGQYMNNLKQTVCDSALSDINRIDSLLAFYTRKIQSIKSAYTNQIIANPYFQNVNLFAGDSYTYSLTTRQGFKLTADIGLIDYGINSPPFTKAYGNNWGRVTPYFGIHWNFHYSNTDIPFSRRPYRPFARYSFFLGATILSVAESGKFNNLFGSSALLAGLGYRVNTDGLRIVAGTMIVKKDNPNQLIANTTVGFLPFFGVSYDFNQIFSNMVSLIK
jgi:hypothetical protein